MTFSDKMNEKLKNTLKNGALELGADLSEGSISLFETYLTELKAWNRQINLTAIDSDDEVVTRHFLDSLTPLEAIKGARRLLDIGAGGGFPGLPLKIAKDSLEAVLMDSVTKKVHFMRHIIRKLNLKGAEAIAGRAEDRTLIEKYREDFDAVISRAFTELKGFLTAALPYVAPGGAILAMKGPGYKDELKAVEGFKGLSAPRIHEVRVPFTDRTTTIIVFLRE